MCTPIKQRFPNYCVPACIESVAKDFGINLSQEQLVKDYADVFPDEGGINDVGKNRNLQTIFQELGIAIEIYQLPKPDYNTIKKLGQEHEILLFLNKTSLHCVRLCGFADSGELKIMDPSSGEICYRSVLWYNEESPGIIFFNKRIKTNMSETSKTKPMNEFDKIAWKVMFGGLLGFSSVLFAHLTGKDVLDIYLEVSIYCFAVSIPFLVLGLMYGVIIDRVPNPEKVFNVQAVSLIGLVICFIGIGLVFYHFHWMAAVLFCIISFVCAGLYSRIHTSAG